MKTLGTTIEGNYIVEMTPDEHYTFLELESTINGKPIAYLDRRSKLDGTNLAPVFTALSRLFEARVSIVKVKEYVNYVGNVLGGSYDLKDEK
jgi:hypothetical protein